jgi:hypothetical protein
MFLRIEDIQGESQESACRNQIEVISWDWGLSQAGSAHSGTGAGSGKVSARETASHGGVDELHGGRGLWSRTPSLASLGPFNCRRIGAYPDLLSEHALGNAIGIEGFEFGPISRDAGAARAPRAAFTVRVVSHWDSRRRSIRSTAPSSERLLNASSTNRGSFVSHSGQHGLATESTSTLIAHPTAWSSSRRVPASWHRHHPRFSSSNAVSRRSQPVRWSLNVSVTRRGFRYFLVVDSSPQGEIVGRAALIDCE